MTLDDLNRADRASFVGALDGVFEHSPWVAERAWVRRPFPNVDALHTALVAEMLAAQRGEQLALLCAHPDLGARQTMSQSSVDEQASAGLDRLSDEQQGSLRRLNSEYRARFGFPFLLAVKGATERHVIECLEERLTASPGDEWDEALRQVARIARFRLDGLRLTRDSAV